MRKATLLFALATATLATAATANRNKASKKSLALEARYTANFTAVWAYLNQLTPTQWGYLASMSNNQVLALSNCSEAQFNFLSDLVSSQLSFLSGITEITGAPAAYPVPVTTTPTGADQEDVQNCLNGLIAKMLNNNLIT
jgi:hypothetical protein